MGYKFKSLKFWSFVVLTILIVVLLGMNWINEDNFAKLLQVFLSIFVLGNVGSKFGRWFGKHKRDNRDYEGGD